MAGRRNWSDEEVRHALALYLVTPFGRLHSRNPDITALAERLGRSASAVALKLTNLAALDDSLPRKGMAHASAADRRVWREFLSDPAGVLSAYRAQADQRIPAGPQPGMAAFAEEAAEFIHREGGERRAESVLRVGQEFFRRIILASYRGRCALTGIEDRRLLTASHIVPWREDAQH
ncbi:MAG: HNH endonuclease, partial [Alphaproteobacteria bacterium]